MCMKDQRRERALEFIKQSDFIEQIAVEIANGGCLIDICQARDIRYSDVWLAIKKDPEKLKLYEAADLARTEWIMQRILKELRAIATVDIREAFDDNGNLLPIKKMPASVASVMQSVEVEDIFAGRGESAMVVGHTKRIKLWDKLKSLELLGKNLAMFVEKHEIAGHLTLEDLVAKSREIPKVEHES